MNATEELIAEIKEIEESLSRKYGVGIKITYKVKPVDIQTIADIVNACLKEFVGTEATIFNGRRVRHLVTGRIVFAHIARENGYGLSETGKMIGKDHSSVCHYHREHEKFMSTKDKLYLEFYNFVQLEIENARERHNQKMLLGRK